MCNDQKQKQSKSFKFKEMDLIGSTFQSGYFSSMVLLNKIHKTDNQIILRTNTGSAKVN